MRSEVEKMEGWTIFFDSDTEHFIGVNDKDSDRSISSLNFKTVQEKIHEAVKRGKKKKVTYLDVMQIEPYSNSFRKGIQKFTITSISDDGDAYWIKNSKGKRSKEYASWFDCYPMTKKILKAGEDILAKKAEIKKIEEEIDQIMGSIEDDKLTKEEIEKSLYGDK